MGEKVGLIKNIVFSTTRQWNPGDEFILFGVLNLLNEILPLQTFNPIIYNRNPDILQPLSYYNPMRKFKNYKKGEWIWGSFLRACQYDNSFKIHYDKKFVDLIIVAGSPGWFSLDSKPLYSYSIKFEIPTLFLGIGIPSSSIKISNFIRKILKASPLITVRDRISWQLMKDLGIKSYLLPCPAFWASTLEKRIEKVRKVGIIFSSPYSVINNRVHEQYFEIFLKTLPLIIQFFRKNNIEIIIITHYIDELYDFITKSYFSKFDIPIYYSYDARDYLRIYKTIDFVIGFRLHGVILSASFGIPGLYILHDYRGGAIDLFEGIEKLEIKKMERCIQILEQVVDKVSDMNRKIINIKTAFKEQYIHLLKPVISRVLYEKD